jgi:hypothetical protein
MTITTDETVLVNLINYLHEKMPGHLAAEWQSVVQVDMARRTDRTMVWPEFACWLLTHDVIWGTWFNQPEQTRVAAKIVLHLYNCVLDRDLDAVSGEYWSGAAAFVERLVTEYVALLDEEGSGPGERSERLPDGELVYAHAYALHDAIRMAAALAAWNPAAAIDHAVSALHWRYEHLCHRWAGDRVEIYLEMASRLLHLLRTTPLLRD